MQNVVSLLPHAKKDSKVESKQSKGGQLNELVELRSCSSCLFFDQQPHWKLLKELITQVRGWFVMLHYALHFEQADIDLC